MPELPHFANRSRARVAAILAITLPCGAALGLQTSAGGARPARREVLDSIVRMVCSPQLDSAVKRGTVRYRARIQALGSNGVPGARAATPGRACVRADANGMVTLDSLPPGRQLLEVTAIGYAPETREVMVRDGAPPDTIVLTPLHTTLDTLRVIAVVDPTGFHTRRGSGVGQFVTADQVERQNPRTTTALLRTMDGVRYDPARDNGLVFTTGPSKACVPDYYLDGFPMPPGPERVSGLPMLDWNVLPEDIGGIEIYKNPAEVPARFAPIGRRAAGNKCGAIVFWTRSKLGMPPSQRLHDARP